jgi:hypothetical protein
MENRAVDTVSLRVTIVNALQHSQIALPRSAVGVERLQLGNACSTWRGLIQLTLQEGVRLRLELAHVTQPLRVLVKEKEGAVHRHNLLWDFEVARVSFVSAVLVNLRVVKSAVERNTV